MGFLIFAKVKNISSTTVLNKSTLYIQKRFTGNKNPGHVYKIMNTINSKSQLQITHIADTPKQTTIDSTQNTKIINELPYNNMSLEKIEDASNPSLLNKVSAKFLDSLNYIVSNSFTIAKSDQNTESLKDLLQQAENRKLITYELDNTEKVQEGTAKLTKEGLAYYNKMLEKFINSTSVQNTEKIPESIQFVAGMLKISDETIITLPKQMHFVVAYDLNSNTYKIIGILTSEKDPKNLVLTLDQPISKNADKEQLFRFLSTPLIATSNQIEFNEEATRYVQRHDVSAKLIASKDQYLKKNAILYDSKGLTKEDLIKLLTMHEQQIQKPAKKLSHYEQEKLAQKLKKAELNKQKQKEEHQKKLKQQAEQDSDVNDD